MSATPSESPLPPEFSLVQGGPLFQILVRAHLEKSPTDFLARRIAVIVAVAWLPLLVLSVASGHAFAGAGVPFLFDVGAHARLLVCLPLLLVAEAIVHTRIKRIVQQFIDRGIVVPEDRPRFDGLIASAMLLRSSVLAEVLVLALAIAGGYSLGERYISMNVDTWYAQASGDRTVLTAAGYWYFLGSLTIFRFLLFRWYFRLFVWYRFLWQVARRIKLRLNALHPDGAGGLGFLSGSAFALQPLLFAQTVALSGILAGKIFHEGAVLTQFKLEIAAWMVFLILLALTPLAFFAVQLADAKRAGLREYGLVGSRYVAEFRRRWIDGEAAGKSELVGSADIQSLADLSNSYAVVREMGVVPFGRTTVLRLVVITALPFAPLTLTMIPLEQLIDRALQVFF